MNKPTLSIILTAAYEPKTIGKAIRNLILTAKGFLKNDFEIITVIPDQETYEAAKNIIKNEFRNISWISIVDPHKGKPTALNLAFIKARGAYLLLSDGDVHVSKDCLAPLFDHFKDKKVGAVTGRPISADNRETYWGYLSHLLADGAHHKRMVTMTKNPQGHSLKFVSKTPKFFVLSGYLSLIRNLKFEIPADCLVDDAFLSYIIHNKGYSLNYEPGAKVFVKYPTNIRDWFDQKARSVGGYMQLWEYKVVKKDTKVRNFYKELEYFWFPLKYSKNIKEFIWSLSLYFLRAYLWLRIFIEQKILKKDFYKTWVRIESTK
jgi:cellulose synthase/poly-beta-1,6-N-acetylglucosamine synthase-like glycosyltransferase